MPFWALRAARGEFTGALAAYEEMRNRSEQRASGPRGTHLSAASWVARLERRLGRTARANEVLDEAIVLARQYAADLPDLPHATSLLALIHALRSEKSEALTALDRAIRIVTATCDASQISRIRREKADTLGALGQIDEAIAELRTVHQMGWGFGYTLRHAVEWEPLRGSAKFQQLMKEAEARADAQPRPARPR